MPSKRPSDALYRLLIRAYPKRFRLQYEQDLLQWFRQHRAHADQRDTQTARIRFWWTILADLLQSVPTQHLHASAAESNSHLRTHPSPKRGREPAMEMLFNDARLAIRSFAKSPAFFALTVATLAVGVGFATTIFSVVDGVLLAPLPYADAKQIVTVGKLSESGDRIYALSAPDAFDLERRNHSFEALAVAAGTGMTLRGDGEPEILAGALVSSAFFDVLGVQPTLGRAFTKLEDEPGAAPVAVLGHSLWQRRWGGDRSILGKPVTLGQTPFIVVGIMPPDFMPPEALGQRGSDVWIPLSLAGADALSDRRNGWLQGIGRLRDDVSLEAAQGELLALGARFSEDFPGPGERRFGGFPLHRATVGDIADKLLPLFGAVALLLLIACANVANLLLVRAGGRRREMALRTALGAGRGRIVRQLLTESSILGLIGGCLGVAIAVAGVRAFVAISPGDIPRLAEITVNGNVLAFAAITSVLTSLLFGLAPVLRSTRPNLVGRLKEGTQGSGSASRQHRLRNGLVIAETAIAFVLVIGAGLLINSFLRLQYVDKGFDAENVHVLGVAASGADSPQEISGFYQDMMARLRALPGVTTVGVTGNLPLSGRYAMQRLQAVEERTLDDTSVYYQYVSSGFFRTMGINLRRGRVFDNADRLGTSPVAVVNEAMARDLFGENEALGERFQASDGNAETWFEIIGVVANVRTLDLSQPGLPEMYLSFEQAPQSRMDIVVRTAGPAPSMLSIMREQLRSLHPELPIRRSVQMGDFVAGSIASPRFYTLVLGSFAGVALLLALVGIYGTLTYVVCQQSHELGVRMALGATGNSVCGMVLGRGLRLVTFGIALGVAGALLTTRALGSLVFGITPTDGATMVLGVATVLVTALMASLIPALRATKLDPIAVLRNE